MQKKMGFMKPQKIEESLMYFKYFVTFPLILHKKMNQKIATEKALLVLNTSL
jgi:hypothetical protein